MPYSTIFGHFWDLFNASVTHIWFKTTQKKKKRKKLINVFLVFFCLKWRKTFEILVASIPTIIYYISDFLNFTLYGRFWPKKWVFEEKNGQHSGCWQGTFYLLFPKTHLIGFSGFFLRQNWNFESPKFWSKLKKTFFSH